MGLGDVGLGDVGLGDVGLGDVGLGDVGLGDVGLGDTRGLGDVTIIFGGQNSFNAGGLETSVPYPC